MLTRRQIGAAAAALAAPSVARAQAPPWPQERTVEVIVLANPGGPVDVMTRMIMPHVAERIPGFRPVVTNRAGAGGQIGLEATFNAAPDGYTLGTSSIPAHLSFPVERPVRYRPLDFTFIANIVEDPNAFYVLNQSPFRSVADIIDRARAAPGTLSCATTGIGSDDHIFLMAFEALARIPPLVHVPFTGNAPLMSQLLGGHLDLAAVNINDAVGLIREGKLRALAAAGVARSRFVPDVPTMRELGFDIVTGASRGVIGPPGLPAPIVAKLEEGFRGALADPRFIAEAERQFMPLRPLIGVEYKRMAEGVDEMVRGLWHQRPWRER